LLFCLLFSYSEELLVICTQHMLCPQLQL
jgi:hypothetical protein